MPLPAILAGAALKLSPVGKFLKAMPWQVWAVVALIVVYGVGSCVHEKKADAALAAADKAGYDRANARIRAKALRIEREVRRIDASITPLIRNQVDAENRVTAERADALLLRGPGRAACALRTPLPDSAGGHDPAGGGAGAAAAGVPEPDRIAVPFDYAVKDEKVDDANRTEVLAWRRWHKSWTEAWAKLSTSE